MSAVPVPSVPARDDRRIDIIPVGQLRPYPNNARKHSKKQVRQIADSIGRFGFNNPVLIDGNDQIIAGHGRVEAAKLIGLAAVPAIRISHLTDAERRAFPAVS
jgi:ParB-like chromosome segregation protein Spo0J